MNFMDIAFKEAIKAKAEGNVPVGCVIVRNNNIVSSAHNLKNTSNVSVYHAEILAIIDACNKIGNWYLDECDMYVTLKPCDMCTAAIAESRIKRVFYLLDSKYDNNLKKNIDDINYFKLDDDCYADLISNFFKELRN